MERVDYQKTIIQDLVNDEKSKQLNLEPWYQRRSVWNDQQKGFLINTIFEQMPVPSIYVRHSIDMDEGKSIKEVVDGQQRIRSILDYCNNKFAARHPSHKGSRVKYSDLSSKEKSAFLSTGLSVGYLIDASDSDVIEIFGRINSVAKTLNGQEKRNAEYSGEYKQFCLSVASKHVQLWRDCSIFTATQIARMEEIQFVSDLTLNFIKGLSDFSQPALNKIYAEFDGRFPLRQKLKQRLETVFSAVAELDTSTISDTIFSRPPLMFSLLVIMDQRKITSKAKLRKGIVEIDRHFNSDVPYNERKKAESDFYLACTSSTQRIKARKIRDSYIKSFF